MNIVLISICNRWQYLHQTLDSLFRNAADKAAHEVVLVCDTNDRDDIDFENMWDATYIVNRKQVGASASRNIGASSIPKYRRQKHLMFLDDDVYMCPDWDVSLELYGREQSFVLSGHAHPFNHDDVIIGTRHFRKPLLVSSVNMVMPWSIWDDVGYFTEPGGPGGSEDYDWCMRAKAKGYGFAVTDPHCVIHCGLTSSNGKQIVGFDLMTEQNRKLVELYGLTGKVIYA